MLQIPGKRNGIEQRPAPSGTLRETFYFIELYNGVELGEFRELASQSLPRLARGRTVRYTLVRTPGEFFVNKIHRQQYLDLRSIPIMRNYRFIQSTLTHSEYSSFREDFYRDFDFLKIRDTHFKPVINIASRIGFELYGFSASGNGRMDVKSPGKDGGSEHLMDLMEESEEKGMKPFLLTFRKNNNKVTIRKDFNYFIHGGYWDALELIYRTSTAIVENDLELLEKISRLRLKVKAKESDFTTLDPIEFEVPAHSSSNEILDRLSGNFNIGKLATHGEMISIYAFHKSNESSTYRIDVSPSSLRLLPMVGSRMEGMIELLESVEEAA